MISLITLDQWDLDLAMKNKLNKKASYGRSFRLASEEYFLNKIEYDPTNKDPIPTYYDLIPKRSNTSAQLEEAKAMLEDAGIYFDEVED